MAPVRNPGPTTMIRLPSCPGRPGPERLQEASRRPVLPSLRLAPTTASDPQSPAPQDRHSVLRTSRSSSRVDRSPAQPQSEFFPVSGDLTGERGVRTDAHNRGCAKRNREGSPLPISTPLLDVTPQLTPGGNVLPIEECREPSPRNDLWCSTPSRRVIRPPRSA